MTREEHIQRHKNLHKALDELLADYIKHTEKLLLSKSSIMNLLDWSCKQTLNPTTDEGEEEE